MYMLSSRVTSLLASLVLLGHQAISVGQESVCQSQNGKSLKNLWSNLKPSDLVGAHVAVLPVGSIESHGPHLPFGTDLLLAEAIARRAVLDKEGVVILPATPFGASFEHGNKVGTIPVHDETLNRLWDDVLTGVVRSGLTKIVVVNAHGGQTQNVELAIRKSRFHHDALVVSFNAQAMLTKAWRKVEMRSSLLGKESVHGIHGGLIETAVMMYLFPELVDINATDDFRQKRTYSHLLQPYGDIVSFGWRSEDLSSSGALGDAKSATADIGAKIFHEALENLELLILELLDTKIEDVLTFAAVQTTGGEQVAK